MFRRKLLALEYQLIDTFNPKDETSYRHFVLWLEDQKIRHYPIDDRQPLRQFNQDVVWKNAFEKYLKDVDCPYDANTCDRNILVDWLLGLAVRLEYGDNHKTYNQMAKEPVVDAEHNFVSENPLDNLNFEDPEFKRGVEDLAKLLNVTRHPDHLITLKAISKLIQEKLSESVVNDINEHPTKPKSDIQISLDKFDLGFDCGDQDLNNAAKVLRLLHVKEIRDLQTKINETIVSLQVISADPKTNDKLGKIGI